MSRKLNRRVRIGASLVASVKAFVAVGVFASLPAIADVTNVTASLEYVGNPAKERWPSNNKARGVLDLQFYRGLLFAGSGEVESNPGPTWLHSIDPVGLGLDFEYSAGTEAVASFRIASWGELLAPSQDPHEGDPNQAHVYVRGTNAVWRKYSSVGGTVPLLKKTVLNSTHIWDMEEFDGRVFTAGYQLHWSTNRCVRFVDTGSITNAYRRFDYRIFDRGYAWWSLRRQMQLLRFPDSLYAVPNALIQPNCPIDDDAPPCNQVEVFAYDPSTKKFTEGRQAMSTLFPNVSSNDFRLVLSSQETPTWDPLPTLTYDALRVRLWRTTPFKDRVLYVGCYDTRGGAPDFTSYPLPLMGCSAYVKTAGQGQTKSLAATRLSFDGDTEEYPWDFTVVGDVCYALTSKPNASTKVVRHSVWKSTDGTSFTRVFSFDFHQNMISLDYRDGWFWLGVGVKNATRGYAYNSKADEAGAIYRVRLPQEPTSVEAVNPPATVQEGGTATIPFRLAAQPSSNLTLRVAARASQQVTLDKSSLTFTTSNWQTPQNVVVSLADDAVADTSRILVTCGADAYAVERGEFVSPAVTSAPVFLTPIENDMAATVSSETNSFDTSSCTYTVTYSSLGNIGGSEAASASVSVRVYADEALTRLAGQATGTVTGTGVQKTFTVTGLERGTWYWLVAETTTAPGVARVYSKKYLSPIANPEELVDLMDDESSRAASYAVVASKESAGVTAFDNKDTKFGGYRKPIQFVYRFKTPMVVNGLGVWSMADGDPDKHPSTIEVFGGSGTNKSDLVKLATIKEPDWKYKEWRRWVVTNETPYAVYKVQLTARHQHCYVSELELYEIGADQNRAAPTVPVTSGSR